MKKINITPKVLFVLFSTIYVLGGLSATILSFIFNFNKEYVGVAFLTGTLVALLLSFKFKYIEVDKEELKKNNSYLFKISLIIYFVLCPMLIYSFLNSMHQYYLPYSYFIIVFIISGLILSQVLLSKNLSSFREKIVLFEILFLSIIIFSSFLFLFPTPYGNDANYHVYFIKNSINARFLIGEGQYVNYPVFHLLFIYILEISKIENLKIIQFILMIVQNIILLLGFLFIKRLFNNKVGLISLLFISIAPYISIPKFIFFPGAFTAVLFVLILYLIFYPKINSLEYSVLFIISSLAMIFAHPMTPLILISALVIIFLSSKLQFVKDKISLSAILFVLIVIVSWWMKPSGVNTNDLFTYAFLSMQKAVETSENSGIATSVQTVTSASTIDPWTIISSDLGFILLVFLAIIGAICLLANYVKYSLKYKDFKMNAVYLAIITLIFIPIPYVLAIIYPDSLPARWFPFIEVFSSIFAGLSGLILFNTLSRNKTKYLFIMLLAGVVFLLVSNPIVNPNSHLYASQISTKCALTDSELDASNFISQYSNITETKGNSKFIALINMESNGYNYINPENSTTYDRNYSIYNNSLIVFRNYDTEKGFTVQLRGDVRKLIYPSKEFYAFIKNTNEIYDSGNLWMYS